MAGYSGYRDSRDSRGMGIDLEETQVIRETLRATLVRIQEPKQLWHQYLLII